jgi:hypothetical protein
LIGGCPDGAIRAEVEALLASADDITFLNAPVFADIQGAMECAACRALA